MSAKALMEAASLTSGLAQFIYGIVQSTDRGWSDGVVVGCMAAGVALLGVFCFVEARVARSPLVPFAIFRIGTVAGSNIVSLLLGSCPFGDPDLLTAS